MSNLCVARHASASAELNVTCDREKIRALRAVASFDSFSTPPNRARKNFFVATMSP
jgi:hypothetical protein